LPVRLRCFVHFLYTETKADVPWLGFRGPGSGPLRRPLNVANEGEQGGEQGFARGVPPPWRRTEPI
jgi:hypothetical protein